MSHKVGHHYKYELVEKYLRNVIENSYDDRGTLRLYVASDEEPFINYMKEKFGDIVIYKDDIFRYNINTSGQNVVSIADTKNITTEITSNNRVSLYTPVSDYEPQNSYTKLKKMTKIIRKVFHCPKKSQRKII